MLGPDGAGLRTRGTPRHARSAPPVFRRSVLALGVVCALALPVGGEPTARADRSAPPSRPVSGPPGPATTGVPAGTVLTEHHGDVVLDVPGATYDSLDIHGFVKVKAPNVTITRSIVRGGEATGNTGLITVTDPSATGFVLEDSELVPEFPSVWIDGIKGAGFTVRRVEIRGTTDNVKIHGDDVTVQGSWLHSTVRYRHDPNQGGGPSHNDAVQILGGRNISIVGNRLEGAHNAGIQVTQGFSRVRDLVIRGNLLDGGGCSINLASGSSRMRGVTVQDNRFGTKQRIKGCGVIASRKTELKASGNTWRNGAPVQVRNGG